MKKSPIKSFFPWLLGVFCTCQKMWPSSSQRKYYIPTIFSQQICECAINVSITFSVSNLYVTLSFMWPTFHLSPLQRHSVFHLHSCCEAGPSARVASPRHTLWLCVCVCHASEGFQCTKQLHSKILVLRKSTQSLLNFWNEIKKLRLLFWCSCSVSVPVAVGLPLRLPPHFMRKK